MCVKSRVCRRANGPRFVALRDASFKEGRKLSCPLWRQDSVFGAWMRESEGEGCWVGIWLIAMRILGGLEEGILFGFSHIDGFLFFFFNSSRGNWRINWSRRSFWKFFFFWFWNNGCPLIRFDDEEFKESLNYIVLICFKNENVICKRSFIRRSVSESLIGLFGSIFNTLKSCTKGQLKALNRVNEDR